MPLGEGASGIQGRRSGIHLRQCVFGIRLLNARFQQIDPRLTPAIMFALHGESRFLLRESLIVQIIHSLKVIQDTRDDVVRKLMAH